MSTVKQEESAPVSLYDHLQQLIDDLELRQQPHVDVYPEAPKPEDIVIPTGGFAKCVCRPGCTKELPEPAYRILGHSGEDQRWNLPNEAEQALEAAMTQLADACMSLQAVFDSVSKIEEEQKRIRIQTNYLLVHIYSVLNFSIAVIINCLFL
uniref:Late endosomal/lysosomal adaptor and MAPK and MTOR activator 1 n=1 Tax=Caenorhabditis tropicalis TaxID=1561998 RepID=A0A1I7TXR4_9PELO